jgi:hypothetical protein
MRLTRTLFLAAYLLRASTSPDATVCDAAVCVTPAHTLPIVNVDGANPFTRFRLKPR